MNRNISIVLTAAGVVVSLLAIKAFMAQVTNPPSSEVPRAPAKIEPFSARVCDREIKMGYYNDHSYPVALLKYGYSLAQKDARGFDFEFNSTRDMRSVKDSDWVIVKPQESKEWVGYQWDAVEYQIEKSDRSTWTIKAVQHASIPNKLLMQTKHSAFEDYPGQLDVIDKCYGDK